MTHRGAALVTLAGGVLMGLGSFLPWITARTGFTTISTSGTDGDGIFTLGAGAIVALLALLYLDRGISTGRRILLFLAGLLGLLVSIGDYGTASQRISTINSDTIVASIGPGLYLVFIGSCAVIIGAWRYRSLWDESSSRTDPA